MCPMPFVCGFSQIIVCHVSRGVRVECPTSQVTDVVLPLSNFVLNFFPVLFIIPNPSFFMARSSGIRYVRPKRVSFRLIIFARGPCCLVFS